MADQVPEVLALRLRFLSFGMALGFGTPSSQSLEVSVLGSDDFKMSASRQVVLCVRVLLGKAA